MDRDIPFYLALARGPDLGVCAVPHLLADRVAIRDLFPSRNTSDSWPALPPAVRRYLRNPDWRGVERDLDWLRDEGDREFIPCTAEHFPALLRAIQDPPVGLFLRGDTGAIRAVQLAVVGTRAPSADGRRLAQEFGGRLAACGITVTSGLAHGVDGFAHRGALERGGRTVAVLGSGLDTVYPRCHTRLAHQVQRCGALVSEFPTGRRPLPGNFPRRNRIISGLCVGTLVVEAALRSGSLITARHAVEQGRDVFAIPGAIRNIRARGCHALLRQGAKLVEAVDDILEEIGPLATFGMSAGEARVHHDSTPMPLDGDFKLLLDNIGFEPVHIDSLIEITRLPVATATSLLSNLEIAGLVEALPGGNFVRCAS